jgi:hypothetical protein
MVVGGLESTTELRQSQQNEWIIAALREIDVALDPNLIQKRLP